MERLAVTLILNIMLVLPVSFYGANLIETLNLPKHEEVPLSMIYAVTAGIVVALVGSKVTDVIFDIFDKDQ